MPEPEHGIVCVLTCHPDGRGLTRHGSAMPSVTSGESQLGLWVFIVFVLVHIFVLTSSYKEVLPCFCQETLRTSGTMLLRGTKSKWWVNYICWLDGVSAWGSCCVCVGEYSAWRYLNKKQNGRFEQQTTWWGEGENHFVWVKIIILGRNKANKTIQWPIQWKETVSPFIIFACFTIYLQISVCFPRPLWCFSYDIPASVPLRGCPTWRPRSWRRPQK